MGRTIQALRELDTETYDWFNCKKCGEPEFIEKPHFIKKVLARDKLCDDCVSEKEKTKRFKNLAFEE